MIIQELRVKNYRSIKDATLSIGELTALVGRNGAGKSNFLNALALFFDPATKSLVNDADRFANDPSAPVSIGLTFGNLDSADLEFFAKYVRDGTLRVTRLFDATHDGTFHGEQKQLPEFKPVRDETDKRTKTKKYNELRDKSRFSDLPKITRSDQVDEAFQDWESRHPDDLKIHSVESQFFGYTNVRGSAFRQRVSFLHIPAVRDAQEDATDGRGSSISDVVNELFRSELEQSEDLGRIRESAANQYDDLVQRTAEQHVPALERGLSNLLQGFSPGNEVSLGLTDSEAFRIPAPQVQVNITEDGYETSVERTGHGTQRAFIFSVLRKRAEVVNASSSSDEPTGDGANTNLPSVFLAIEEPELYQHPTRQRHIAATLRQLTAGSNAASVQVMYTTHSPQFVSMDRCDDIRVIRKSAVGEGEASATVVSHAKFEDLVERLRTVRVIGKKETTDVVRGKLKAMSTVESNEGIFARCVVLVEGDTDRAVLCAVARRIGHDLDERDISVIPCSGKYNIPKLVAMFRVFQVTTFAVWDNDNETCGSPSRATKRIQTAFAEFGQVNCVDDFAVPLDKDLENTLDVDFGSRVWCSALEEASDEFAVRNGTKPQAVYDRAVEIAYERGARSKTIEAVVENIVRLS